MLVAEGFEPAVWEDLDWWNSEMLIRIEREAQVTDERLQGSRIKSAEARRKCSDGGKLG
jgi:hypothetical protein